MEFTQLHQYIESKQSLLDKINALEECINNVIPLILKSIETGEKLEYFVDNGQNKISVKYRDPIAVQQLIVALEKTKSIYVNRFNGRVTRSIDTKNLHQRWY